MWKEAHRKVDGETFGLRECYSHHAYIGITKTEENVMLLGGSGVKQKVVISTWEVPVPVHTSATFSLCPISPGHYIAFKGAAQM